MSTPVQNPRDEKPLSVQLANTILDATVRLEKHLSEQNVASPSLQPGADIPRILPPNVQAGVGQALDALHELNVLLLGPIGFLMMHMGNSVRLNYFLYIFFIFFFIYYLLYILYHTV